MRYVKTNRAMLWLLILSITAAIFYGIHKSMLPFFISFIIAYLLHPLTNYLAIKLKISREIVVLIVFSLFLGVFIAVTIIVVPLVCYQFAAFVSAIPIYKDRSQKVITYWLDQLNQVDADIGNKVASSMNELVSSATILLTSGVNHVWQYATATMNFFMVIALVPVILYYSLRDWPRIVKCVSDMVPIKRRHTASEILQEINELLAAYIRGQLNICILISCYYIIGFTAIGLELALLSGLFAGVMIIIPLIGTLLSYTTIMISCYFTFGSGVKLMYITLLYASGYVIDGYILGPRIIGDKTGLHPLWIMFAMVVAADLLGFFGIILAVPLAGIIKVCVVHLVGYYKNSELYKS